jgi:HK97 family phage major capsid protein
MAVIAVVLDKPLDQLSEGTVLHLEEADGQALISAGLAHEATADEVNGEESPEDEGAQADEGGHTDDVLNLGKSAKVAVEKGIEQATEKALNIIAKSNKSLDLPSVKVDKSWSVQTNERKGGFPTFKAFLDCAVAAKHGDFGAAKKMDDYHRLRTKTAMSVGTSTAGGSLVPQQWADEIWALTFSGGPDFLSMMTKYEMQNQVINVPEINITAGNTGITASVTNENTAITDTTALTNSVQLSLIKMGVLVNITDELMRFQSYNLETYIRQHVPAKMRFKINDSIVNGSSSGVNLIGNAATVTIADRATTGHITFPDIVTMWTSLYTDFQTEACWIVNPTAYGDLMKLSFPNGSGTYPIFLPTPPNYSGGGGHAAYAPVGTLFNRPVHVCEQAAALGSPGDIILVHFPSIACGYLPLDSAQTNALYFDKAVDSARFLQYVATKNLVLSPYTRADSSTCSNTVILPV